MGAHAYSIARDSEKAILATVRLPADSAAAKGLPAAIPIALATLLATGYVALIVVGLLLPNYSKVDQSGAHIAQSSEGVMYQNPAYGISLQTPANWMIKNDAPNYILLAVRSDHACTVTLQPIAWSPMIGLSSFKGQLSYQFSKSKDLTGQVIDEQAAILSGLNARDIRASIMQGQKGIIEHHTIARKGMTLYDLCTDELAGGQEGAADPTCASDFSFIRKNLVLPH